MERREIFRKTLQRPALDADEVARTRDRFKCISLELRRIFAFPRTLSLARYKRAP